MKKPTWHLILPVAYLGSTLSSAMAGHYDGPSPDVNLIHNKPAEYAECEQYINRTAREYAACNFGLDEAERMAERFGGGNGRINGYLRGLSWGMYKMSEAWKNDGSEMEKGEKAVDGMGQYMESGLEAGRTKGRADGTSAGNSDGIDRFLKALKNGSEPDATLKIPATNYQGEDNAYQKYVGAVPTPESIIKNEINPGGIPVYDSWDAVYLGEKQALTWWDLWFADGVYIFEKAKWYDQNLAMQVWFERKDMDQRPKYNNLNNPPLADAAGAPIDLQAIFKKSFVNAYGYYVSYYFSQNFHQNMDQGQFAGEAIGMQVGKRVAQLKGTVKAFNEKFKASSAATHRDSYVGAYSTSFNETFNDYNTHPKLSIDFQEVIGMVTDGILQPGEAISAKFKVTNVGGAGTSLSVGVQGDVTDVNSQTVNVKRLSILQNTLVEIAKIDARLRPRDTARIFLTINGESFEKRELVQRMLEIAGNQAQLEINEGQGAINTAVTNISTVRTPGLVSATLSLNGRQVIKQQIGFVAAGQTVDVVLPFSGIDPMDLINGNIKAKVVVAMDDAVLDQSELGLVSRNPIQALISYGNQLVNGLGYVPSRISRADRTAEVVGSIVAQNKRETIAHKKTSSGNPWRNSPETTVVGMLVTQMNATTQSDQARAAYDSLAKQLYPHRKNFRKIVFFFKSGRQKHFERFCKELSREELK